MSERGHMNSNLLNVEAPRWLHPHRTLQTQHRRHLTFLILKESRLISSKSDKKRVVKVEKEVSFNIWSYNCVWYFCVSTSLERLNEIKAGLPGWVGGTTKQVRAFRHSFEIPYCTAERWCSLIYHNGISKNVIWRWVKHLWHMLSEIFQMLV